MGKKKKTKINIIPDLIIDTTDILVYILLVSF